jgi:hypothetical protein
MEPAAAAAILKTSLKTPKAPSTIADAATASGLALRDAERGLQWLTHEYRGHLRVTEDGDLLFLFPTGFTKPWQTTDALSRAASAVGRGIAGVGRFIVRAWLMIVLVAYAALFLAILIGTMFAQSNNNSSSRRSAGGGELLYVLFRVLGDALFWTFHPFSPVSIAYAPMYDARAARRDRRRERADETPFYEKVNRFVFGPTEPPVDPRENERRILAEIRAGKGRIGLGDVMRVTGLPRDKADPMMARLMLDYDGEVEVSDEGGIYYRFEAMRKSAQDEPQSRGEALPQKQPSAAPSKLAPLTGNGAGANVLIAALNGFNALMALYAIDANLTLAKLAHLGGRIPLSRLPYDGVPIVLGVIPLVFSLALFALPLARAALRPAKAKKVARENARLSVLREVLSRVKSKKPITDAALSGAWAKAAGKPPESKELTREVVALGGDVDIGEQGEVRYRFADLETEATALEAEREAEPDEEARVGKVVFASDN